MQKEYYYYIDEAGDLIDKSESKVFILGCIITDTPKEINRKYSKLMDELEGDMYYRRHKKQILKEGFHACSNHPDLYTYFVRFIHPLNYRAYFLALNKSSEYFKSLISSFSAGQIYDICIKMLLHDRLIKRKNDLNKIVFEQNLPRQTPASLSKREKEISLIINELNEEFRKKHLISQEINFTVELHTKSDSILSIVDYMSHIVSKVIEGKDGKVENYMKLNFKLIEPKIGCIFLADKKEYIKIRNKELDIDTLKIN